jgi:MSHA biogenesis protein MshQ
MKFFRIIFSLVIALYAFPSLSDDTSCKVHGQGDFTISFDVEGDDDDDQYLRLNQGNRSYTLWYTSFPNPNSNYIFNERTLIDGKDYQVVITHDVASNLLKYYRRDAGSAFYTLISSETKVLHNGNLWVVEDDLDSVDCLETVVPPPLLPDLKEVKYEFGSIEGVDCTKGCNLPFDNEYENPIVILMSTINASKIEESAPSKSSVTSIWPSKKGATIESEGMANSDDVDRMSPIYYFVTEPGKLKFFDESGKVVYGEAGIHQTSTSQCKGSDCSSNNWDNISYDLGELNNPVVLTQIQGKDSEWATTAIGSVDNNGFNVALERGRQGAQPSSQKKTVAYLAVPSFIGSDVFTQSAIKFHREVKEYNQKIELSKDSDNYIGWSCEYNEINLETNFSRFGVIANKQTRNGGDGGWLRYCKQYSSDSSSRFTFAFDEDTPKLKDRKHGKYESIGYFAFEIPHSDLPLEKCSYFPEPIQGWNGSESTLAVSNNSVRTTGWSQEYQSRFTINNTERFYDLERSTQSKLLMTGFERAVDANNVNQYRDTVDKLYNYPICSGKGCDVGNKDGGLNVRKISAPLSVSASFGTQNVTLTGQASDIASQCSGANAVCSAFWSGNNGTNVDFYIEKSMNTLTINTHGNDFNIVRVHIEDGVNVKHLDVSNGNDVELVIPDNAEVTFDSFIYQSGTTKFLFGKDTRINIVSSLDFTNSADIVTDGYVVIYGPQAQVTFRNKNNTLNAFILAEFASFENPMIIEGAVTSQNLVLKDNVKINKPAYNCPLPEVPKGTLKVEPVQSHVLTCEVAVVEFRVEDELGNIVTSVQDNFVAEAVVGSADTKARWCEDNSDITSCGNYGTSLTSQFINGKRTLYLSSSKLNSSGYEVSGTWNGETVKPEPNTTISFVPYKFDVAEQRVVAGKPKQVTAKVLSCDAVGSPKSEDYIGQPAVSLEIELPPNGYYEDLWSYQPKFTLSDGGETQAPFSIQESGQFRVTLEDDQFDCSEISGCPTEGKDKLSGSFIVKSRPWTFAVCPPPSINGTSGDADSGLGFVAAGEPFNLYVKPVVWDSSLDVIDSTSGLPLRLVQKQSTRSFCTLDVTQNFFLSPDALKTRVDLESSLATPTEGKSGLPYIGGVDSFADSTELEFADVSVSEVGSFHFTASTSHAFYDEIPNGAKYGIEDGAREIGRFYPKYFKVLSGNEWYYPGKQDGDEQSYAYMSQPFEGAEFQVQAFNAKQQSVQNYASFAPSLTADFTLYSPGYGARLKVPAVTKDWDSQVSIGTFTIERPSPSVNCDGELCWEKGTGSDYPDGPFNGNGQETSISITDVGLGNIDPVVYLRNIQNNEELRELSNQPNIRFGRMVLDNAGGTTGEPVGVPLRVEFWDSSMNRFVINTSDSHTAFAGIKARQSFIWPDDGNDVDVTFGGNGRVGSGLSQALTATQASEYRQQTEIWLDLEHVSNGLPWLKYDWDTTDAQEENPSTVVTFGIYRGNDRVIYRGESGLTGQ